MNPIPERIGKYEVISQLGAGASSSVYLAYDPFIKRKVAIKLIHAGALRDPKFGKIYRKQLFAEASLAGQLVYPHIVNIYDAVLDERESYIVMEYVAGGTLEKHANVDNLLPLDRLVEIAFKCCKALNFAHSRQVIHRVIKPANIMIGGDTGIKIADFGAALVPHADTTQISGIGSPAYMSPQQVREETLNFQTDIFSLGVVMYQLLTGKSPFASSTHAAVLYQIMNITPPPPSTHRREIPPELDRIVMRAIEKDLGARYQTWEEFAHDLASIGNIRSSKVAILDTEKFSALKALPFFEAFTEVELWEVLRISSWSRLPAHAELIREGSKGNSFYILAAGEVNVTIDKKLLNVIKAGDCFGEMAYLGRRDAMPRSASVEALTNVTVIKIDAEALDQASENCQLDFNQAFLRILVQRLMHADLRLAKVLS